MPNDNLNTNNSQELNLDEVIEVAADALSDDQKAFLEENKADLSDEVLEKFGLEKESEKSIDAETFEIKTRYQPKEKAKGEPKIEDEDEGDEIDPDDRKVISKIVEEKLKPIREGSQKVKDAVEVDTYIGTRPEYRKYRGVMLKLMEHPSYNNLPAEVIAAIVTSGDQQKLGAEKERGATKKANDTHSGGSTARKPQGGAVDWGKASPEELADKKAEIFDHRV